MYIRSAVLELLHV